MSRGRGVVAALARMQRDAERARAARARDAARAARDAQRRAATATRARSADQREQARLYARSRAADVDEDNAQLERDLGELQAVLAAGLGAAAFDLETFKPALQLPAFDPSVAGPPPAPPQLEAFLPAAPSAGRRMFGGGARHAEQTRAGHANYQLAVDAHQVQARQHAVNLDAARRQHDAHVTRLHTEHRQQTAEVEELQRGLASGELTAVVHFLDLVLEASSYPPGFSHSWRLAYTPESQQVVVDYELPSVDVIPDIKGHRYVKGTDTVSPIARPQTQIRTLYAALVAQTALRVTYELLTADRTGRVHSVVLNAHATATHPATGRTVRPCLLALGTTRNGFAELDLARVDPAACLRHLEARVSRNPAGLVAVEPMVRFDSIDLRFVSETGDAGAPPVDANRRPESLPPIPAAAAADGGHPSAAGTFDDAAVPQELTAGQNVPLTGPIIDVSLPNAWSAPADLSVLLLGADGRVADDTAFIFFNNPRSAGGAVALRGGDSPDGATIDLSLLDDACTRLVLVASSSDQTSNVSGTPLLVRDPAGQPSRRTFQPPDVRPMPSVVCAELYRRQGGWRLRAVGQGWADGLARLARDYGVEVD